MKKFINICKALSDKTRLKILWVLGKARTKLCVCEIMDALGETQYNVSRHLKELRVAGLVREEREGRWVFYSLIKPPNRSEKLMLEAVFSLAAEVFSIERKRLQKRLSMRRGGKCVVGMKSAEWRCILMAEEKGRRRPRKE
jgi:ArsR family transcriptional regulator